MNEQEKCLLKIIKSMDNEIESMKQIIEDLKNYHNLTIEFYEKEIELIKKPRRFKIKSKGA